MNWHILLYAALFVAQAFFAGHYLSDEIRWDRSFSEKVKTYVMTLAILFFGIVFVPIALILAISGFIHHRVLAYFHIPFIVKYILLKRPLDYNEEGGQRMKERAAGLNPKWYQVNEKIFIWIDRWVEKKYRLVTTAPQA